MRMDKFPSHYVEISERQLLHNIMLH